MSTSSTQALTAVVQDIVARHHALEGPLLPILHAVQAALGYVPPEAQELIAAGLNISKAEVHGVVSFYHDFRDAPAGRTIVRLCRAEACQSMGGDALAAQLKTRLGLEWGETSADGSVTLEPVFCLGLCACAPAAMVNDRLVGRLDETRFTAAMSKEGAA